MHKLIFTDTYMFLLWFKDKAAKKFSPKSKYGVPLSRQSW